MLLANLTIEPFVVLFTLGSPIFWLLFLVVSGCIIWALEENRWYWAGFSILAFIAACIFLGDTGLVKNVIERPYLLVPYGIGFVGLGVTWGFIKWFSFLHKRLRRYQDAKLSWLRDQGEHDITDVPDDMKEKWTKFLLESPEWSKVKRAAGYYDGQHHDEERMVNIRPRAWENKSRIIGWMSFWPWSVFWYLLGDLLRDIFNRIYAYLGGLFEQMSRHVFKKVDADIVLPKTVKPVVDPDEANANR